MSPSTNIAKGAYPSRAAWLQPPYCWAIHHDLLEQLARLGKVHHVEILDGTGAVVHIKYGVKDAAELCLRGRFPLCHIASHDLPSSPRLIPLEPIACAAHGKSQQRLLQHGGMRGFHSPNTAVKRGCATCSNASSWQLWRGTKPGILSAI